MRQVKGDIEMLTITHGCNRNNYTNYEEGEAYRGFHL